MSEVYACRVLGRRSRPIGVVSREDAIAVCDLLAYRHPDRWVEAADVATGEVVVRMEPREAITELPGQLALDAEATS